MSQKCVTPVAILQSLGLSRNMSEEMSELHTCKIFERRTCAGSHSPGSTVRRLGPSGNESFVTATPSESFAGTSDMAGDAAVKPVLRGMNEKLSMEVKILKLSGTFSRNDSRNFLFPTFREPKVYRPNCSFFLLHAYVMEGQIGVTQHRLQRNIACTIRKLIQNFDFPQAQLRQRALFCLKT